ncbi:MAG: CPBP family intramembrane glutamic endopeptidase [Planctomycetota bacterium]|nr:CPBP family intramembrane glutamic endopeptidase [Planctomycetota bacterium]
MSDRMLALLAVGVCTLAVWTFIRLLRPGKFSLSGTPARPNALHLLHVLAVYLIYMIIGSLTQLAVAALQGIDLVRGKPVPMTVNLPAMGVGHVVLIAGVLGVASMTFRSGPGRGLGLSGRRWISDIGRGIVGFLAVLPLCIAALMLTNYLIRQGILPIKPKEHPALEFVRQASPAWIVAVFAVTVAMAPIAEELFFRGLLQSLLRKYLGGPWPAILVVSVIFAAIHHPLYKDMPALFLLGVALGYNYERTGRLLGPIVMHAIFNAAMLWQTLA